MEGWVDIWVMGRSFVRQFPMMNIFSLESIFQLFKYSNPHYSSHSIVSILTMDRVAVKKVSHLWLPLVWALSPELFVRSRASTKRQGLYRKTRRKKNQGSISPGFEILGLECSPAFQRLLLALYYDFLDHLSPLWLLVSRGTVAMPARLTTLSPSLLDRW